MDFDINRLRRADQVIGGGAIAFFIFLFFFHWYGVSSNVSSIAGVNVNISKSGWDTFTNSRWIWLLTIIVALGVVFATATQRHIQSPVGLGVIVAGLGGLSAILILYRIVHHPTASASFGSYHASLGIKLGIWLGLIAAGVVTYGGYLAMQAEGTSLSDVREQAGAAFSGAGSSSSSAPGAAAPPPAAAPSPPPPAAGTGPAPPLPPPTASETAPPLPPPAAPEQSPPQQ
jgi:hypothetical protein